MAFETVISTEKGVAAISASYLLDETRLCTDLVRLANISDAENGVIARRARGYVATIRASDDKMSLLDAFLQEYGLSTLEGVALMRLSEALVRTPDFRTSRTLVRDKIGGSNWSSHVSASETFLVNRATDGLQISAAWIKATGGSDARRLAAKLGDKILVRAVRKVMSFMGEHFVLGRTIEEAVRKSHEEKASDYRYSFDMLGEAAYTAEDAERYFDAYMHAAKHLETTNSSSEAGSAQAAPSLSVKLSALHPRYEYNKRDVCVPALVHRMTALARVAKASGFGLTIDAEEADRLEVSLLVVDALLGDPEFAGWNGLGVVVQAYQRRAVAVINHLIALTKLHNRKISVRLVKGAYWDTEIKRAQELGLESYPVFTRKSHTDVSYLACARVLLGARGWVYPRFATHNAHTAAAVIEMAGVRNGFEFQRLYGMGEELHRQLLEDAGVPSRVYAPVGAHKDLLPYLVRRLLENGANSSFVNQLFDEDTAVESIISNPIETSEQNGLLPDDRIGAPRDMFAGDRLAALGIDLTQAATEAEIMSFLESQKAPYHATSLIDGNPVHGEVKPVISPFDGSKVIGAIENATVETVDVAVSVAHASTWSSDLTAVERSEVLHNAADLLEAGMEKFLWLCVFEAGKTLPDAVAEVREAVDFCRYYANQAKTSRIADRTHLGVVACISPWNFPLAIFLGQIAAALSVGNSVVAKPAPQTPLISHEAIRLLIRAGIPSHAVQLLIGDGAMLGGRLTAHPNIAGICFTGSTATAKRIASSLEETNRAGTPFIAETGGINVMIVDSTALLEQAVQDVIVSAFQSAGQRCSACRIVAVQTDIADAFIEMLAGAIAELDVGPPERLATDVGPVIDREARERLARYIEDARSSFGVIAQTQQDGLPKSGHFIAPIAFEVADISDVTQEVFGPVLHVVRFSGDRIETLIDDINALGFGLTMGLHTRIDDRVEVIAQRAHVGNLYINRNQIGAVVGVQPFGGEGLSGTGPKAGGPHYLLRLTKGDAIGQGAQDQSKNPMTLIGQNAGANGEILSNSKSAHRLWSQNMSAYDRRKLLCHVFSQTTSLSSEFTKRLMVQDRRDLPGPTGETNELRLFPRGVLCLVPSSDIQTFSRQLALALFSGNGIISANTPEQAAILGRIRIALENAGAPSTLIQIVDHSELASFFDQNIDGVISEDITLAEVLCRRAGAIIPLLTSVDEPERYYHERTLTINTTAAGGNASLLAMTA